MCIIWISFRNRHFLCQINVTSDLNYRNSICLVETSLLYVLCFFQNLSNKFSIESNIHTVWCRKFSIAIIHDTKICSPTLSNHLKNTQQMFAVSTYTVCYNSFHLSWLYFPISRPISIKNISSCNVFTVILFLCYHWFYFRFDSINPTDLLWLCDNDTIIIFSFFIQNYYSHFPFNSR